MTEISPEFLERLEGPNGQFCVLLKRVPYDVQRKIELDLYDARTQLDADDVALRALKVEARVDDYLTGEDAGEDFGVADTALVISWRKRATEIYNEWYAEAFPSQKKGSSRTARRQIPSTSKASTSDAAA